MTSFCFKHIRLSHGGECTYGDLILLMPSSKSCPVGTDSTRAGSIKWGYRGIYLPPSPPTNWDAHKTEYELSRYDANPKKYVMWYVIKKAERVFYTWSFDKILPLFPLSLWVHLSKTHFCTVPYATVYPRGAPFGVDSPFKIYWVSIHKRSNHALCSTGGDHDLIPSQKLQLISLFLSIKNFS